MATLKYASSKVTYLLSIAAEQADRKTIGTKVPLEGIRASQRSCAGD